MKKSLVNPASILTLCMLFLFNLNFASIKNIEPNTCLKLNGLILKSPNETKGLYKIELFKDNSSVEVITIAVKKAFEFKLTKNSLYTLRVSKEGYIPILLKVDTKFPVENSSIYEFLFQTELHPITVISAVNKEAMEEPIGLVKYDAKNDRFYPEDITISPLAVLKLNGMILKSPNGEKGTYKIELLQDNTVVDAKDVKFNDPFEFNLVKNAWYTVRITKEGFIPLLISVDTEMDSNKPKLYEFNFETELYHTSQINHLDKGTLDLPIGLVKFDVSYDKFQPTAEYRAHIPGSF
ncbi:MAG: hypothetical protein Q7W45_14250 [Bacteroidota bacterium]|nr:hypothetical protein [Bacteroidota bacterium]MDP3144326.1 hypothetical protein [Bacteroidota bacterium]MDP3556312.1 hypothetical protein [Bacteroidota bacterium]